MELFRKDYEILRNKYTEIFNDRNRILEELNGSYGQITKLN